MNHLDRRQFLGMAGLLVLAPVIGRAGQQDTVADGLRYFSARADLEGHYFLSTFDPRGQLHFEVPLPGRGHASTIHPHQDQVVQVARRPGRYLLVIDTRNGSVLHHVSSCSHRHFCGHAVFSADGRWLYTTENDYDKARGVIGVRDVTAGYRQVGELPSHGVGPHDVRLLSDGRTLVVANGGIHTHPDTGRAKLNLATMSPSLAYLDAKSGELLEERRLPQQWHQNSIRHLAIGADDRICFIMQYQGSRRNLPALVGLHRRGEPINLCRAPDPIQRRMRNYCGSACSDTSGRWFAVSSPRGNLITFWDARSGRYDGFTELPDGCGVAAGNSPGEFVMSSGQGAVQRYRVSDGQQQGLSALNTLEARWDNHMSCLRLEQPITQDYQQVLL